MKKILLITLFFTLSLSANCKSFYLLGSKEQTLKQQISSKNSLVWTQTKSKWTNSELKDALNLNTLECKERAFVLLNNNDISYAVASYEAGSYALKRGWNYLASPKNGLDVVKTFKNSVGVEFVYVYDKKTAVWAGFSPLKYLENKMLETRILQLKKIEPGIGFYVYATRNVKITIQNTPVTNICKILMSDDKYSFLTDSGKDETMKYNSDKTIGVYSRYFSHYRRGVYDETRLTLIYPKLKAQKSTMFRYGPAVPKSMLEYNKAYENTDFYMFDYKEGKCYKGTFPSMKTPPFSSLKEMK